MFCYVFAAVERDVEFALGFVKSVRSMRADYQLTPKMKTECRMTKPRRHPHISPVTYDVLYRFLAVFVQCSESTLESTVQNYDDLIRTLTSSTKVSLVQ